MTEASTPSTPELPLTPGAQRLVDEFAKQQNAHVSEWLGALLDRYAPMLDTLMPGFDKSALRTSAQSAANTAAPLDSTAVLQKARTFAQTSGKLKVAERDIAAVVLRAAGYEITVAPADIPRERAAPAATIDAGNAAQNTVARTIKPTPTLDKFGRDLTRAAFEGKLSPVVGRAAEIETTMETLCRRTKRNPLLVGPAGTGKTAIVEGLAQRIVKGDVPAPLKGVRLISLQPSSLVAGAGIVGELEKRLGAILAEADQDGVLIFIDEVHAIMGAGGREGTGDMASMIKPALARGDIACIAATTNDEYRKFIEADRALERRFQPIRVEELSPAQTLEVIKSVRDDLVKGRNIEVGDDLLAWLVDIAKQFMPNRCFPDKAVDLLDQTIAFGVTHQLAKIERSHAEQVVRRMLGMPSLERIGLDQMRASLVSRGLVSKADADLLVERLEVTSRGLDMRAARPNAVVLLSGELVDSADEIAVAIAEGVYGSTDRVVRVDLGRLQDDSDSNVLLGSPPGYIGYSDRHALDALAEMPWSVVLCTRADLCHRSVLAALTPGIASGVVTDMRGRRIYFSDAVVILTVASVSERPRAIGFGGRPAEATSEQTPRDLLGDELASTIDFVFSERPGNAEESADWITTRLLPEMAARHRERGVELVWDASVVEWLTAEWKASRDTRGLERQMENQIGSALVRELYSGAAPASGRCVVKRQSASVIVERVQS